MKILHYLVLLLFITPALALAATHCPTPEQVTNHQIENFRVSGSPHGGEIIAGKLIIMPISSCELRIVCEYSEVHHGGQKESFYLTQTILLGQKTSLSASVTACDPHTDVTCPNLEVLKDAPDEALSHLFETTSHEYPDEGCP